MSDNKNLENTDQEVVDKALGFWQAYGKKVSLALGILVVAIGGYWAYGNFIQQPKEAKANEDIFAAENYFRKDSFALALNGTGSTPGFLKIIDKHSGTKAANLAHLYAGESYLQMGEFQKAIDQLNA
jgi:predicted negative regulator of RcsB-dependent stress response